MKNMARLVVLVALVSVCTLAWADHHKSKKQVAWFDAGTCEICKPMSTNAELMSSMKWETHKVKDGMLMVAMIPQAHQDTFEALCAKMQEKGQKIATASRSVDLCGFCESYGKLMQAGAQEEKVKTAFGNITLLTARDRTTVKMIHKHAERTQKETQKMLAAAK